MTPYLSDCAACEYDRFYHDVCIKCPIIWPDDGSRYNCILGGLYTKWRKATGEQKTELARQIRDLPWKFEQEKDS